MAIWAADWWRSGRRQTPARARSRPPRLWSCRSPWPWSRARKRWRSRWAGMCPRWSRRVWACRGSSCCGTCCNCRERWRRRRRGRTRRKSAWRRRSRPRCWRACPSAVWTSTWCRPRRRRAWGPWPARWRAARRERATWSRPPCPSTWRPSICKSSTRSTRRRAPRPTRAAARPGLRLTASCATRFAF